MCMCVCMRDRRRTLCVCVNACMYLVVHVCGEKGSGVCMYA